MFQSCGTDVTVDDRPFYKHRASIKFRLSQRNARTSEIRLC